MYLSDMKEILIINLTRMGDLLQTTPLIEALKEDNEGASITLLINSAFKGICEGIPVIDDLITFDMQEYRCRLTDRENDLVDNYRILDSLIEKINCKEYDLVINVTHSPISAIITSLVKARETRGFTIDSEGHRLIKHPWMRYFFNVIPTRKYNPFHLVDMYIRVGGIMPTRKGLIYEITEENIKRADAILNEYGYEKGSALVGVHLGASKSDKTWPVASYRKLSELICSKHEATVLVFGSKEERELADEFVKNADMRYINLAGRTDIDELAGLLKRCSVFITNDTGPLHIATAAGTKVIDISTANVHFMETGPYGEGHYVIQADLSCAPCGFHVECNNRVCKELITPDAVFEIADSLLNNKTISAIDDSPLWKDIQVYVSEFEEDGMLGYSPLIIRPLTKETLYRIVYRHVWSFKTESDEDLGNISSEIVRKIGALYSSDSISGILRVIDQEAVEIGRIKDLAIEAIKLLELILAESEKESADLNTIGEIWKQIEVIDERIEITGHSRPSLAPLAIVFNYSKEAMEGEGITELSRALSDIYRELLKSSSVMYQIIKGLTGSFKQDSKGENIEIESMV